ncbi:MAG: dihydropteroate synthase [Bacteroidales bacterium]|nr:dihydropteroate synthase [Bacteroidales bacterium]
MGIININNESFYGNSRKITVEDVEKAYLQMIEDGADIIDIGACSTRPGSTPVSGAQEWKYLEKPLERLAEVASERFCNGKTVPEISIDTFRSEIARKACDILGPIIVNDISAGEDDPEMLSSVAELGLTYVAMHKRGTPDTMQSLTDYPDGVVTEVKRYFEAFAEKAEKFGIEDWILDPGFGFAKTVEQNYELLELLDELTQIAKTVLVGLSRKSMIYRLLGITPEESLPATCVLNFRALQKGATILRVHDVKEAVQTINLYQKLNVR